MSADILTIYFSSTNVHLPFILCGLHIINDADIMEDDYLRKYEYIIT